MKTLLITELLRKPELGPEDRLKLKPGVNVLVGRGNTGKSKWLRMLDYLMGDDDDPKEQFEDLAEKYDSVQATVEIGDESFVIERKWKEAGFKTKVIVDDNAMSFKEYRVWLLTKLGIPLIHYPKGNPYGPSTWPELGWRSLYRHVYRQQRFWSDLADQQPPGEQHACLLQFLGLADRLYSEEYGDLVKKQKKVIELQVAKEQFIGMLQQVSKEVTDERELGVALTQEAIEEAELRIRTSIDDLQRRRSELLEAILHPNSSQQNVGDSTADQMSKNLLNARGELDEVLSASKKSSSRLAEVRRYSGLVAEEIARMHRAKQAGDLLSVIKITHCPACDRTIHPPSFASNQCYLCGREHDQVAEQAANEQRLDFELDQLEGELAETHEMVEVLEKEVEQQEQAKFRLQERIAGLQADLAPARAAAAAIIPPDLAILDMGTGRLQERLHQLNRVRASLARREELSQQINEIQQQVADLQGEVADQKGDVDYEKASDLLTDGFNNYLNKINAKEAGAWSQPAVSARVREHGTKITVGNGAWATKLGGSLTLYFLIAYHYALLSLVGKEGCHYPGLVILDFPGKIEDITISDRENFVVEPFVDLTAKAELKRTQFIAAGSAFKDLKGANRIVFTRVWKAD